MRALLLLALCFGYSASFAMDVQENCVRQLVESGLGDAVWSEKICSMSQPECVKRIRPYVDKPVAKERICLNYDNLDIALSIVIILQPRTTGSFSEVLRYGSNYSAKKIACALDMFSNAEINFGAAISACELQ